MPDQTEQPILTDRLQHAFELASTLHRHHVRKETCVAYLSHLTSVAALVQEDGGDEDKAMVAQPGVPEVRPGGDLMEEVSRVVGKLHAWEGLHTREGWEARDEPANRKGVDRWEPG